MPQLAIIGQIHSDPIAMASIDQQLLTEVQKLHEKTDAQYDKVGEALITLARVEERQVIQNRLNEQQRDNMGDHEKRIRSLERETSKNSHARAGHSRGLWLIASCISAVVSGLIGWLIRTGGNP